MINFSQLADLNDGRVDFCLFNIMYYHEEVNAHEEVKLYKEDGKEEE